MEPDYIPLQFDLAKVRVYHDPASLGKAAATFVEGHLNLAIREKGFAHLVLATGASQFTFLDTLKLRSIDWQKVIVFHLDEYKSIAADHQASFRRYLKERILDEVNPRKVYFLRGDAPDINAEVRRYAELLQTHPIDIACIGIGENGHIAFNDPPVANFEDPALVKVVSLDEACRRQQLGEGWFPNFEAVPKEALTLTIPAIMRCKVISCVVPDFRKAEAVGSALNGPVEPKCPASVLRRHQNTVIFLDKESSKNLF